MKPTTTNLSKLFSAIRYGLGLTLIPVKLLISTTGVYQKTAGSTFGELEFANNKDPLLAGNLEAAAAKKYPEAKFPELWMSKIPVDLDRPLIQDGEMPDGSLPQEVLAASSITDEGMRIASARALTAASIVVSLLLIPLALFLFGLFHGIDINHFKVMPSPNQIFLDGSTPAQHMRTGWWPFVKSIFSTLTLASLAIAGTLYFIWRVGSYLWLKGLSFLVNRAAETAVADLAIPSKEQTVRRNWRMSQTVDERAAWLQQLKDTGSQGWDKTPTIAIGTATGHASFAGALNAPVEDQPVALSLMDLTQHLALLGGTGSGKTRRMITPIIRQLARIARKANGKVSFYVTDAKSVLWRDLGPIFKEAGIDTRVIGVEPGMNNMSLFQDLAPEEVVDMLISAAIQVFGGTREFWTNSAGKRAYVVLMIARAWRITDDGIAWADERDEDPYSIAGLNAMATSPAIMKRAVDAVLKDLVGEQRVHKAGYFNVQLEDAINSDVEEWALMADEQKSGVLGTLSHLLSDFLRNPKLRSGFASGRVNEKTVNIKDLWDGKATMICLPPNSLGTAALITNVFLKTRLFKESREREERSRNSDAAYKKWQEEQEYMYFVADEYQSLITTGGQNSDSDFWNVSRSARVSGIIATQSISALEAKVGKDMTTNFMNEMRSRIFGASECEKTINFMSFLAGKTLRSMTFTRDADESLNSRMLRYKKAGNTDGLTNFVFDPKSVKFNPLVMLMSSFESISFGKLRFKRDSRFIMSSNMQDNGSAATASRQAAAWRSEDKHDAWMSQGNSEVNVLSPQDMIDLGSSYAFVSIMRAGRARRGIVKLPN